MSTKRSSTSTETTQIPGMGPREQAIVSRLEQLGLSQADALQFVMDQTKQGPQSQLLALQGPDKALLDQAYTGAEANLRRMGSIMGQDLAGTRGLNPSDTPVSEAVLREMLPQAQMLASQKAQQELGLGLNLGQLREQSRQFNLGALLAGGQAQPSALSGLRQSMQNERFAGATRTNKQSQIPSIMDSIQQGLGIGGQVGALGAAAMGTSSMPGGAGATTSSMGPFTGFNQGGYNFLVNTPGR